MRGHCQNQAFVPEIRFISSNCRSNSEYKQRQTRKPCNVFFFAMSLNILILLFYDKRTFRSILRPLTLKKPKTR